MVEPQARKLPFTTEIERQALRIVSKDPSFIVKWQGRLKPDHFNEPYIQIIFKVVDEYVAKYKQSPTFDILCQQLGKHLGIYDNKQGFLAYANILFHEEDHNDEQAVKDCLMDHMQAVDYDLFVLESAKLAADGKYKDIQTLLSEITLRHTMTAPVAPYLSTPEDSVVERVKIENSLKLAMHTPWVTLNIRHGGGFQPATVTAFMGPTGSGKSILLVNAGASAVLAGKNVYHFTFELSRAKTTARYDVCLSGATYAERKANPQVVHDRLVNLKNRGALYVIQQSTGTCSTNSVRGSINDYVMMGAPKPDVIILDYLTIMMPNNPDDVDMKRDYAKLKAISEEVRALAMDLDIPVITALQSNRGAAGKEKISKEDIADSYAVMHVLDLVLSINQNDAEKQASKMRLYAAKVRDFADGYTIAMDVNYGNLRIAEDSLTTANYNTTVQHMTAAAMAQRTVAGVHAPLPNAAVNPGAADAGLDMIVGLGVNPVKQKNEEAAQVTQAQAAQAASWGIGHQPPPISAPG